MGTSRSSLTMAEVYPFRPCRIHHNSAASAIWQIYEWTGFDYVRLKFLKYLVP
jgi:hypothetical protein